MTTAQRVSPSFLETCDFSAKTSSKYTDFLTSVTDRVTRLSELLGGGGASLVEARAIPGGTM